MNVNEDIIIEKLTQNNLIEAIGIYDDNHNVKTNIEKLLKQYQEIYNNPAYHNIVAKIDGRIVGLATIIINYDIVEELKPFLTVWNFGVKKEYRRNKIGTKISEDWYYRGACTLGSTVNEERKFDEFDMTYIVENKEIIEIKVYAEYIYEFLKTQKESQLMDFDLLKILQDREYILPKDTPEDLQNKLDKMLETLWSELEDIPFYTKDGIEYLDGNYLDFTPGITTKEDIWHWFDERHSNGIHYLLYEYEIESKFVKDKSYEPICNTDRLIEEIRKINILKYDELIKIVDRLEMFDNSYMFELREVILDEAQVIKMNNFDKKYDSDEIMKNDLIKGIKDIATMYGISEENENTL